MLNRSIVVLLGLLLSGAAPASAQNTGPLVRGKRYASIEKFDEAVLDWLVATKKGRIAVSLPAEGDTARMVSLRAAAAARGIAVTAHAAGKCPTPRDSCMGGTAVTLDIFPPEAIDSVRFRMSFGRWENLGDRVALAAIHVWFARTPGGFLIEGVIVGVT